MERIVEKSDVPVPCVMEEIREVEKLKSQLCGREGTFLADKKPASNLDGSCASQAPEWEEGQRFRAEELVTIRDTNKLLNDNDSLVLFKETLPSPSLMQVQSDKRGVTRRARAVVRNSSESPGEEMVSLFQRKQTDGGNKKTYCSTSVDRTEGEGERGQEEGSEQVEKDVMDWTVVTRNKRQKKKLIQIFVKVNGSKATPMEVSLNDDKVEDLMRQIKKDEDAYVTMQGKVLRGNEKLNSCGVTDGCTIQVTSRMRGGGRKHKDKKSKAEKNQAAKTRTLELMFAEDEKSDKRRSIRECDTDTVIRMIEENEAYRKIIECVEGGNDDEVEAKIQWYLMKAQESRVFGEVRREVVECGIRGAVEKKRKGRGREEEQSAGQEQGREVRSRKEEQSGETEAQSTEKQKVISGAEELRTGRGSAGLVRGGDERCLTNETCRKGKGKGNGGKGEHGGKGGFGSKGTHQRTRLSKWRLTWGQVAHTPRPWQTRKKKRQQKGKRKNCEGRDGRTGTTTKKNRREKEKERQRRKQRKTQDKRR